MIPVPIQPFYLVMIQRLRIIRFNKSKSIGCHGCLMAMNLCCFLESFKCKGKCNVYEVQPTNCDMSPVPTFLAAPGEGIAPRIKKTNGSPETSARVIKLSCFLRRAFSSDARGKILHSQPVMSVNFSRSLPLDRFFQDRWKKIYANSNKHSKKIYVTKRQPAPTQIFSLFRPFPHS